MDSRFKGVDRKRGFAIFSGRFVGLILMSAFAVVASGQVSVTTYHYNNMRTGWNSQESILTPAVVASPSFGLLRTVALDDQVNAQPLIVAGVNITAGSHQGKHNVVYVTTEHNTIYAINVNTGVILLRANFGAPVPRPLGCVNNGPNVGIDSTPVVDAHTNTMYVLIYTNDSSGPAYRIHALDLGSLTDKIPPRIVAASHTLTDGTTQSFNATYQRQRPGLLLANGNIYAGFGSFCDQGANISRGWLLAWQAGSLVPLDSNEIFDIQATSPNNFFLSAIWMSGYGLAADSSGNVLFVTGNSDFSGTTYDGITNLQESVVKVSSDLTTVLDLFTPSDQSSRDQTDSDFGSGGVMILPDRPGAVPHIAAAAGKDGSMFLMNEDDLGGYSTTANHVLGTYNIGKCWCGPSFFVDPTDQVGRVVSSGGRTVQVWKLRTSPKVALQHLATSPSIGGGQDGGFFTSVSSNGHSAGTAHPIVWALSRPVSKTSPAIFLFAFDPESGGPKMKQLFRAQAGTWPIGGNANLVPVVANGIVFVATYKELSIFGVKSQ